jgi:hypothetical protein
MFLNRHILVNPNLGFNTVPSPMLTSLTSWALPHVAKFEVGVAGMGVELGVGVELGMGVTVGGIAVAVGRTGVGNSGKKVGVTVGGDAISVR